MIVILILTVIVVILWLIHFFSSDKKQIVKKFESGQENIKNLDIIPEPKFKPENIKVHDIIPEIVSYPNEYIYDKGKPIKPFHPELIDNYKISSNGGKISFGRNFRDEKTKQSELERDMRN
jgi:hypothetical protein